MVYNWFDLPPIVSTFGVYFCIFKKYFAVWKKILSLNPQIKQNNLKLKTMKKVIINTKSNYRNLNDTIQEVFERVGTRITCLIFIPEYGKEMQVDFHISEVTFLC